MKAVVVGAGAVGLSIAYRLAASGYEVDVVDAHRAGSGTSINNAGWVVPIMSAPITAPGILLTALRWLPSRTSPLHIRPLAQREHLRFLLAMLYHCRHQSFRDGLAALIGLGARAIEEFEAYKEDGIDFESHDDGMLMAFKSRRSLTSWLRQVEPLESIGHRHRQLTITEGRQLQPSLSSGLAAVVHCPDERRLDPASFVLSLVRRCRQLGVTFHENCGVTSISHTSSSSTAVCGDTLRLPTDLLVLAAGAWTGQLARMLDCPLPIRPGKGYGFDLPWPAGMSGIGVYLAEARVNLSPLARGLRITGVMDFGDFDMRVDPIRAAGILRAPESYIQGWTPPTAKPRPWAGLRPMTPDGLPCIGPLEPYQNVLVAAGHGLLGITLAPATADLLMACLQRERSEELVPFRPNRFASR